MTPSSSQRPTFGTEVERPRGAIADARERSQVIGWTRLFELVCHLVESSLDARLVNLWRARHSRAADHFIADLDGQSAGYGDDIRQRHLLADERIVTAETLGVFGGRSAKEAIALACCVLPSCLCCADRSRRSPKYCMPDIPTAAIIKSRRARPYIGSSFARCNRASGRHEVSGNAYRPKCMASLAGRVPLNHGMAAPP